MKFLPFQFELEIGSGFFFFKQNWIYFRKLGNSTMNSNNEVVTSRGWRYAEKQLLITFITQLILDSNT